ncbi:MAG: HEAT repeat domain-containing protein, partial [Myxococcales bacterium]|nr:HEAT repeat domain-containing protein [Myxococcales bacterium]
VDAERAVALLAGSLSDEGAVIMAAVESLAAIGGESAARVCVPLLGGPDPELVLAALDCIGKHGDADAVNGMLPLVSHPHWSVRAESIAMLSERGVLKAVPAILRRLETEQDDFVRDAILRALKRLEG